ncbi:hypothetical protein G7Y89_g12378 [Cudoniella acicularis]|uniref:rRNA methyltransferase 1, mitochondrial n=1 Tax=Cudoniella acicularis TaxID=354080 RepID=A0A8H4R998_9HELO|nr:hypothetical protein G7Y89_g12378 [Cudoniella acicularis]
MTSIVLTKNIAFSRTSFLASRLSYHSGTAASVNTAIARGLRKSKGVGFRGSERKVDGPREKQNGLVRRSAGPPSFEKFGAPVTRDGWKGKQEGEFTKGGRTNPRELRIKKGLKFAKTDRELARKKKPDPAGSAGGGRHGGWGGPVRTRFNEEETSSPGFRRRQDSRPTFERGQRGDSKYSSPNRNRPQNRSASHGSGDFAFQSEGTNQYPSLSSKNSFLKQEGDSRSYKTRAERGERGGPRGRMTRSSQEYSGPASSTRGGFQEKPSARDYDGFSPNHDIWGKEARFPNKYSERKLSNRNDSQTWPSIESNNNMRNTSRNESTDDDEPTPTIPVKPTKVFDKQIPLSIPYTTPASEFLYGTSVVEAALTSQKVPRRKHYKLYIYTGENREKVGRDEGLERMAKRKGIKVARVSSGDGLRLMDKMSGGRPHNGYVLEASPLPRLPVTSLGPLKSENNQPGFEVAVDHQSKEDAVINGMSSFVSIPFDRSGRKPMVLFLDSIQDPGNLGGIIRTAAFLGVSAIAVSARNSASFSPVVLKASAGASESVTLFSVNKPAGFIHESRLAGWKVFAAVAPSKGRDSHRSPRSISTDALGDPLSHDPCILMLGSEGEGLRSNLKSKADVEVYIPGRGRTVESLNVSVAAGILCNSFLSRSKTGRAISHDTSNEKEAPEEESNPPETNPEDSSNTLF